MTARFLANEFAGGFFPSGGGSPAYEDFPTNAMTPPSGLTVLGAAAGDVITTDAMGILVRKPMQGAGSSMTLIGTSLLTAPFTGTGVLQRLYGSTNGLAKCGFAIRSGTSGRLLAVELRRAPSSFDEVVVSQYASVTSVGSALYSDTINSSRPSWWKVSTTGDIHTIQYSVDGYAWNTLLTDSSRYVINANAFGFNAVAQLAVGAFPDLLARCIHYAVTT